MREVTIPFTFMIGTPDEPGMERVGPIPPVWVSRADGESGIHYTLRSDLRSPLLEAFAAVRNAPSPAIAARADVRALFEAIARELAADAEGYQPPAPEQAKDDRYC